MRYLFALSAGLWLATVTLAGDQAPVVSTDCSQPVPSACTPGTELFPYTVAEGGDSSGPGARFWGSAEFLYWHVSGSDAPPLITTGVPPTAVVAGGRELNEG